jgi:RNA polymerase sigma-B factor
MHSGVRTTMSLEDLDAVAVRYAKARSTCPGMESRRLRDEMICTALPIAGRLARRYRNRGELTDDLEQVARLGLVKAVDRYDPERGSFTAYAFTTITGEIKRHFRDHTWGVHVPRRLQDLSLEIMHASAVLHHEFARPPTVAELAAYCDVGEDDIDTARISAAGYRWASLNAPAGDGAVEIGDLLGAPEADVDLVDDRVTVSYLIARLPERERRLLTMRFYGDCTQAEIAAELGVSQMHVSRLLTRALTWLREGMLTDCVPRWRGGDTDDADDALGITVTTCLSGPLHVHVAGEVDRDNACRLRDALLSAVRRAAAGQPVTVDLARVPLVDAAGVAVLLAVHESARVRGVPVTVVGLQPHVRQIAAITGLSALLPEE